MQLPITIELHRSRLQPRILALLLSVALIVVLFYPLPVPLRLIGATLLALGGGWMVRQLRAQVAALQLLADGSLGIRGTGWNHPEFVPARMLQGATVHPWLTVLRLEAQEGQPYRLLLTPDCLLPEDFRRLRVFLRWRSTVSASDAPV